MIAESSTVGSGGSTGDSTLTPADNLRLVAGVLKWLLTGDPKIDWELREIAERLENLADRVEARNPPKGSAAKRRS